MKFLPKICLSAVAISVATILTACGGGGGDSGTTATTTATAEGVYGGNLTGSASSNFQMLVLENDEVWTMYGTQTASQFFVAGFVQGNGTSNNGTYTSSNARDFGFNPALAGTASATYNASTKTIAGSLVAGGSTVSFNGGPISGSLYVYNTPAVVSSVAGTWSLTSLTGEGITLTVATTGTFTARSTLGCLFSGSLTPRTSGKNVFNLSITFGASPCALANQAATGIAIAYPLASGRNQLIVAGYNSTRTVGTAAFGTR